MKISYKQRKVPKGPEVYFWDYTKKKKGNKGHRGFGIIILDGKVCHLMHFNKNWLGVEDFMTCDMDKQAIKNLREDHSFYKFHCELL